MFKDPTGMSGESTHTDEFGNVVAVYNDGDNGVYKHNGTESQTQAELSSSYSSSTSGGGTKMGETQYWDEFANHDSNGNILGDKTGNFANKEVHGCFFQTD